MAARSELPPTAVQVADSLDQRFQALGTLERAVNERAYLKSALEFRGVTVWAIRREARDFLASYPDIDRPTLLDWVAELWSRPVHELHMAAIDVLADRTKLLAAADLVPIEHMLRTSYTWAYVDALAVHVAGSIITRNPETTPVLDRWSTDDDFWIRRSSLLALLGPIRKGGGDLDRFFRYADLMLDEKEFFIRKAIGWVLRDIGKKFPAEVRAFLEQRIGRAAGLTVREAVKYLPEPDREALLEGYKAAKAKSKR